MGKISFSAEILAILVLLPTSFGKIGTSRPSIYGIHTHRAHRDGLIELPAPYHRGVTEVANLDLTRRTDITKKGRAHPSHSHEVIFEVAHDKHEEMEKVLWDVSDPKSSNYGNHWTRQEIADFMDCYDSQKVIVSYLESQNIEVTDQSPWGDEVIAKAPIAVWEKVFSTTFYQFEQQVPVPGSRRSRHETIKTAAQTVIRAHVYTLPAELEEHVEAAFNTVQFSPRVTHGFHAFDDKQPAAFEKTAEEVSRHGTSSKHEFTSQASYAGLFAGYINPKTLRTYYGITNSTGSTKTTQGVYAANGQTYSPKSLTEFQTNYGLYPYPVSTVINGHADSVLCAAGQTTPCDEANADVQYLMGTSELTPTTFWYDTVGDLRMWINSVTRTVKPPKILSVSYGAQESDLVAALGTFLAASSYCSNFDRAAIVLALQGVTLFFASGDDGSPGYNVFASGSTAACTYDADFPAASPYVTAVGATSGPQSNAVETTCMGATNTITSGGGFSIIYSQPTWQATAVSTYFTTAATAGVSPYPGYDATKRGYPDVSGAGSAYIIINMDVYQAISGTSLSTPFIAGVFALGNAHRANQNQSSFGWLNPLLYTTPTVFKDTVGGHTKCSAYGKVCCSQGFTAVAGWDPATGWGSVDFAKFQANYFDIVYAGKDYLSKKPTSAPTYLAGSPTPSPTLYPPTPLPTTFLASSPTASPTTAVPTRPPTPIPTALPSTPPTPKPSTKPTRKPTNKPTPRPTRPTAFPTAKPTANPTVISSTTGAIIGGVAGGGAFTIGLVLCCCFLCPKGGKDDAARRRRFSAGNMVRTISGRFGGNRDQDVAGDDALPADNIPENTSRDITAPEHVQVEHASHPHATV